MITAYVWLIWPIQKALKFTFERSLGCCLPLKLISLSQLFGPNKRYSWSDPAIIPFSPRFRFHPLIVSECLRFYWSQQRCQPRPGIWWLFSETPLLSHRFKSSIIFDKRGSSRRRSSSFSQAAFARSSSVGRFSQRNSQPLARPFYRPGVLSNQFAISSWPPRI